MEQATIIEFPKILDPRGNLTFFQNNDQLPFAVNRLFWTYDMPGGIVRGGHAYKVQQELIVALSGSFDVIVTTQLGVESRFTLNRSYYGLYIPPNTWRHLENFSTNSVSLHLCSGKYDESDYIYDIKDFIQ